MKSTNKKAATAATVTTSNSENPIDQDRAAGANAPVAETKPGSNSIPQGEGTSASSDPSPAEHAGGTAAAAADTTAITPPVVVEKVTAGSWVNPGYAMKPVAALRVHEVNAKIYGEKEGIADLEKSVGKYGILDPLLVTKDGRIISGHRRFRVATKLGIIEVPVRVFESDDELDIKNSLLEHNRQRVKNKAQLAAEAKLMQEIETEFAARRKKGNAGEAEVEKLPPANKGKARDAVGKTLGISGRSVDKAVKVAGAIETLKADGKEAEAAEVEAALKKGYDTGYKAAVQKGLIAVTKPKKPKKEAASKSKKEVTPSSADEDAPPVPPAPAGEPAAKGLDSDGALERADEVLTFLRGLKDNGEEFTKAQRKNWEQMFDDIDECRADLSL
jgi:ParB-like chromosome segregation protein Spo0J